MSNNPEIAFIESLEDLNPLIPDEIVEYYMKKTGFECPDRRMIRLISLGAQKFLSDVAHDTRQHWLKAGNKSKKVTFTMEDLQKTLDDYAINCRKPEYFLDSNATGGRQ